VDADGDPTPASSGSMSGSSRDASSSSGSSLASTLGLGSSNAGEDDHTHKAQEIINRAVSAGGAAQARLCSGFLAEQSSCRLLGALHDRLCVRAAAARSAFCV
jgi:hypothetical protein